MERIVIEVDETTAKNWRTASYEKRKLIGEKVSVKIIQELLHNRQEDFLKYLEEVREKMAMRGLTQAELDKILADEG